MKHRYTLLWLVSASVINAFASDRLIPAGYYNAIDGKTTADLKTALHNIIYPHTEISSYQALPQYFQRTDVYPESSRWWDMYSNIPLFAPSFSGLNREHSFPKSWWGGSTEVPAYIDLNHLYPSEAAANMAKSNYPLGTVDPTKKAKFDNGITTVGTPVAGQGGGSSFVFEPDDEYKGDFARTYFYMVTCYQNMDWKYFYMLVNGAYPTLNSWSIDLLLKWNEQDRVSQKEIDRNEVVWGFQNNRNPFIDFPELAEYIWGNKMGDKFILSEHQGNYTPAGEPTLITPTQDTTLEFGEVALGHKGTAKLLLHGENLSGSNMRLAIYQDDAQYFNIDGAKVSQAAVSAVNTASGLWVTVTYEPQEIGEHSTRLVISGGGIQGSIGIGMRGECLPVPTLTAPTATAATDVTASSYTANWTPAPGEVVDYYIVNRTRYDIAGAPTEQLVAEDNYLTIDDFGGSESYTVQSVRLGIKSPESNAISVVTGAITGIEANSQFGINAYPGGILITCAAELEMLRIMNTAGQVLYIFDRVNNNDVIELPAGIYIITAKGAEHPVKAIVNP